MGTLFVKELRSEHAAIGTSRLEISGRAFFSLAWQTDDVGMIYGEAAPLSGYGRDDLELCERELCRLADAELAAVTRSVSDAFDADSSSSDSGFGTPLGGLSDWSRRFESPAARFCGEMLVLRAAARTRGVPFWRLLSTECVAPALPTSAVLDPSSDAFWEEFTSAYERGIRTYKIKCGRDASREMAAIVRIAPALGVRLRLDPNRAWSLDEALRFVEGVPADALEWVEDPTSTLSEWSRLREQTGVALALDEPIGRGLSSEDALALAPDVFVLKPMAVGGVLACLEWARLARERGARVCVSHLFDGRAAMSASLELAFAIQSPDRAPGLGMHPALAADPSDAPAPEGLFVDVLRCPFS